MIPIVNAVTIPIAIALDAMFADRITAEIKEMDAVATISTAGAITHGISCVNHASVCISPSIHLIRDAVNNALSGDRPHF